MKHLIDINEMNYKIAKEIYKNNYTIPDGGNFEPTMREVISFALYKFITTHGYSYNRDRREWEKAG